jgi:hypothetical protein
MSTSLRMGWPVPAENQDPFYDTFASMVAAQDVSVYATREDRNILVMAGGIVSFTASSGLLSWTSPIELNSAVTGFKWNVAAAAVNLLDGEYLFIRLARNPITNTTLVAEIASILPGNDPDNTLILALRNGNRVYWRDGRVLLDGQSVPLFSTPPAGSGGVGSSGQFWRENVAIAITDSANSATPKIMGTWGVSAADYTLNGTVKGFEFCVIAYVDVGSVTGEVKLYDLTSATDAAVLTFVGSTSPTKQVITATISSSDHLYEVRGRVTAGVGVVYVQWAGLRINNVIA